MDNLTLSSFNHKKCECYKCSEGQHLKLSWAIIFCKVNYFECQSRFYIIRPINKQELDLAVPNAEVLLALVFIAFASWVLATLITFLDYKTTVCNFDGLVVPTVNRHRPLPSNIKIGRVLLKFETTSCPWLHH